MRKQDLIFQIKIFFFLAYLPNQIHLFKIKIYIETRLYRGGFTINTIEAMEAKFGSQSFHQTGENIGRQIVFLQYHRR